MRGKFSSAKITDCQFSLPGKHSRYFEETVLINSLNGTTHIFKLDFTDPNPIVNASEIQPTVVSMFASCTRKYKSVASKLMASPEVRMVSQISCNERIVGRANLYGTVVTYTSKNELITFNVIE